MPPEEKSTTFSTVFAGSLDVARRQKALELAVSWGNNWKNAAPGTDVILGAAKAFEAYLKGDS